MRCDDVSDQKDDTSHKKDGPDDYQNQLACVEANPRWL